MFFACHIYSLSDVLKDLLSHIRFAILFVFDNCYSPLAYSNSEFISYRLGKWFWQIHRFSKEEYINVVR